MAEYDEKEAKELLLQSLMQSLEGFIGQPINPSLIRLLTHQCTHCLDVLKERYYIWDYRDLEVESDSRAGLIRVMVEFHRGSPEPVTIGLNKSV